MEIVRTLEELHAARKKLEGTVGLVPTMGFLHAGHISLVKKAAETCSHVVVSIFVNPTQFGPTEDFAAYPRDLDKDVALLKEAGVDIVWAPTEDVMYPAGYQTYITVEDVTRVLEGAMRPTHFKGVTTVVAKLFNAVQPDKAFFGQKDAQQVVVLSRMVKDLNYNLEMVVCPIVREQDGLALSSRNTYLDTAQRKAAVVLSRSLRKARAVFASGERSSRVIRAEMDTLFAAEPLVKVQYISIADPDTLQEVEKIDRLALVSMAVYVGKTRLIDNTILGKIDTGLDDLHP
ncbi:pantoate--beta-alanine ligase [Leptolinea tardivitalis]|uniref:Pantothenate synthetase n=1 Tax=Leptolinea tardivitalis TaxID=229920 RepID=A0A0P6XQH1_9CHLR|nr:pantoate--beta-alanine ligase [Leptolinea tardivitalis]KPL71692.1 pantoate--beta-alanine ligase [Leptolinea tardivitalis]GAP20036.1 pantothenate synthetase [Leptolinea tardivitalis]